MKQTFIALGVLASLAATARGQSDDLRWWPPSAHAGQLAYEDALNAIPAGPSLKAYHELFASEPHIAGTEGDARNIERLVKAFAELGLEAQVQEFYAYLAYPEDAAVEVVGAGEDGGDLVLPLRETPLSEDPYDDDPNLTMGWNAYSGNGDVIAGVVYANYGTKEDFDLLAAHDVDLTGRIVLARYGGNFRGFKAKFAEQAGAAGLIIYTDPADAGFVKGDVYPDGGWANESYIQRGSIETLDYAGDPLTPFIGATEDAERLDPADVDLPHIPVQPIGYGAAKEILSRMTGDPLPEQMTKWQGGLPFDYHLTGGDLKVRLMVKQRREIRRTANVLATLTGETWPDEKIYIGCHHDAWGDGAGDPLSGTMLLFEAAKSFTAAAKEGHRPARTIVFANWGAEEYGIIGSTEYIEEYRDELTKDAIAYINLDAATMGPNFHSSASPSLKQVIADVTHRVPQAGDANETPVYDAWLGDNSVPDFGNLGGGSDHVGFYCHIGVPSCGLGAGGAPGTAYHSNYDDIAWYQKVVGADYAPALMITRVLNLLVARLADAPILPFDPVRYAKDAREHLGTVAGRAKELGVEGEFVQLQQWLVNLENKADAVQKRLLEAIKQNMLTGPFPVQINTQLRDLEKDWLAPHGLPGRPWFRNMYAATDPTSGYAAWMLPALRGAVEQKDPMLVREQLTAYRAVIRRLERTLDTIDGIIPHQAME